MRRGGRFGSSRPAENKDKDSKKEPVPNRLYLRLDGCQGAVYDEGYEGWFSIDSSQFGVGRGIGGYGGGKREVSACSVSELTISAAFDAHWSFVYALSMAAAVFHTAEVAIVSERTVTKFLLRDCLISGFSFSSGSNSSDSSISVSLNFHEVLTSASTVVRDALVIPSTITGCDTARQPGSLIERFSRDPLVRILSHLHRPSDLLAAGLSCRTLLWAASHPSLRKTVTNSCLYNIGLGDKRVGINGYRAPKGLLSPDEDGEGGGRRRNRYGDEEEETPEAKEAREKKEQETIDRMGLKELTREVNFPRHLFKNEDL